jgi:hypothetical protein
MECDPINQRTAMISQDTAAAIWAAYRDIEAGEKLLADIEKERNRNHLDKSQPTLRDAFGRVRNLSLGIPSGENSQRLFDVKPELAEAIIRAHIANKHAELAEANERARVELGV